MSSPIENTVLSLLLFKNQHFYVLLLSYRPILQSHQYFEFSTHVCESVGKQGAASSFYLLSLIWYVLHFSSETHSLTHAMWYLKNPSQTIMYCRWQPKWYLFTADGNSEGIDLAGEWWPWRCYFERDMHVFFLLRNEIIYYVLLCKLFFNYMMCWLFMLII